MDAHQRLVALLRSRSLKTGDFVLTSGKRSSWYIDCRRTTMHAEGLALVGELGLAAIRAAGWTADAVGGMTLGADPVAYAIALASYAHPPTIHGFTVRKAAKEHGMGRRIEGCFESGAMVVVIEDSITTGGSALSAIEAVRAEGGIVTGVLAVVDRGEGGREAIEKAGVSVRALVAASELLGAS
ncbi:MAG: orotate phosphoribosyltransferase [Gemmatimonadales bacterium]